MRQNEIKGSSPRLTFLKVHTDDVSNAQTSDRWDLNTSLWTEQSRRLYNSTFLKTLCLLVFVSCLSGIMQAWVSHDPISQIQAQT